MMYDEYRNKILKIAAVLSTVLRFMSLIIICAVTVLAGIATLLFFKGTPKVPECADTLTYGETLICHSSAFMSDVHFEYSRVGSAEWQTETPIMPGVYNVRAVGDGAFGIERYSKSASFEIIPKSVDVSLLNGYLGYGETPIISASVVSGDNICCYDFLYKYEGEMVTVTPNLERIEILKGDGTDVTKAYDISVTPKTVSIKKRNLTVTVADASREYDGKEFIFDKYEISSGSLKAGDRLIAKFDASLTLPGETSNTAHLCVYNEKGEEYRRLMFNKDNVEIVTYVNYL